MKKKVKIKNRINNSDDTIEINIRAKDHLQSQIKYPSKKIELKKFKKPKYKQKGEDDYAN